MWGIPRMRKTSCRKHTWPRSGDDFVDAENDELAPTNVEDAIDNYDKVLDIVGELCGDVLDVNAEAVDIEGPKIVDNAIVYAKGTQQNHEAMRDAGLYGMALPRKYNGLNFSYVPYAWPTKKFT